ncbi:NIPSNAP family protein [Streptomyces sp. NPDC006992]|uniref:NIPSNAP family protein n=1 Tax=Streptomyces sp. NPDC006992 TaxID=3155601 RepID=UPI0033C82A56
MPSNDLPGLPAVIELRQYTLRPGRRDELVDLFEREFVESQEEVGMRVLGQFRDLDDPDRFVWLRGFPDMASRRRGLTEF